jgi:hypothetical protein
MAIGTTVALGLVLMGYRAWQYYLMSQRLEGGITLQWERYPLATLGRLLPPGVFANWLELTWLVPVEFGVGFVGAILVTKAVWRRFWADDGLRLLMILAGMSLVATWAIRSDVNPFDYAFRLGTIIVMIVGALCAGMMLDGDNVRTFARERRVQVLAVAMFLGLGVGIYEQPVLAIRTVIDPKYQDADAEAIKYIRDHTPPEAVVQRYPPVSEYLPQLTQRQLGVAAPDNSHVNVFCPLDKERMRKAYAEVTLAFKCHSAVEAHQRLRRWHVTHVLVGPVERRLGEVRQFDNETLFQKLFDDGGGAVYELRSPRPASTTAGSSGQ